MKVLKLPQNVLNIQKCLLPSCDFMERNYGSYFMIAIPGSFFGILVKIGLSASKQAEAGFFIDQSVITFKDSFRIKRFTELKNVAYQHFIKLPSPIAATTVFVRVVFSDAMTLINLKKQLNCLQWNVCDILKLYIFSRNSVIFLDNLSHGQCFGIYCLDITGVNEEFQPEDDNIYKCIENTRVIVSECIGKKKYEMCYCHKEEIKLGGLSQLYEMLRQIIEFSKYDSVPTQNVKIVNKVLLAGPPGCGKTSLIHTIVRDCKLVLLELLIPEIFSSLPGETEQKLQNLFDEAKLQVNNEENCVILIEDIDVLCVKRNDNASSHTKRCINKLVSLLEDFENVCGIVIIGTATTLDDVDPRLRGKCFDDEIVIMPPTEDNRKEIISNIFKYFKLHCSENLLRKFALWTPGFVGSDLYLAVQECLLLYKKTVGDSVKLDNHVFESCFKNVLSNITPTSLKASIGLQITKNVDFSEIGGLNNIKKLLDFNVKQQLLNPDMFLRLGVPPTKGILLYGPPGCAKTTLVKALAKESNMTFLSVSSADLYSPYVGDPEKKIIQLFSQARIGAPTIIFIDEIDGLVGSKSGDRMRGVQERVLSTLLVEMDGVSARTVTRKNSSLEVLEKKTEPVIRNDNEIIVIGATNRPEKLDDALKRPGRFDKIVYVPPPDEKERLSILQKLTEKMMLDSVDLELLAKVTDCYSGADLKNLCYESAIFALTESGMNTTRVNSSHFRHVLTSVRPSLNADMIAFYETFQRNLHY